MVAGMTETVDRKFSRDVFLVGLVPTYREGRLAIGAINSLLPGCDVVHVCEGPVGDAPLEGDETDLSPFKKNNQVVIWPQGSWASEVEKRNFMLQRTRRFTPPVWGVYLDADEVFIGAEWVRDLIWANQQHANEGREAAAIPVHVTEVDGSVGRIHRVIRLDKLECHVLSMSQLKFFDSDIIPTFPDIPVWRPGEKITATNRPPMPGEPHIHHRSYYRPPRRGDYRLHQLEVDDFRALEAAEASRLGIVAPAAH